MKLTIELNVNSVADPIALEQFIQWATRLEVRTGTASSAIDASARTDATDAAQAEKWLAAQDQAVRWTAPPGMPADSPETQAEMGRVDDTQQPELPVTTDMAQATDEPTKPKRKGRPPKNLVSAEQQVATLAAQQPAEPELIPEERWTPPTNSGFAVPPEAAMPPGAIYTTETTLTPSPVTGVASSAAVPPAAPPAAAMPPAQPAPQSNGTGAIALEDFKAEAMQLHSAAQSRQLSAAYPFNIARQRDVWPDGSPKAWSAMSMDAVPAEDRRKMLDQCIMLLSR